MALFGLVFAAPVLNVWYTNFMPKCANKIFSYNKLTPYATTNKKMLCGLFLDQTIFASYFLVCFFMIMDYTDTKNVKKAWENLQENFWPTMIVNWKIWPAAQLINFTIIPLHYRLLFANSVGLFWNCYLSYAQYRQEKYEKK